MHIPAKSAIVVSWGLVGILGGLVWGAVEFGQLHVWYGVGGAVVGGLVGAALADRSSTNKKKSPSDTQPKRLAEGKPLALPAAPVTDSTWNRQASPEALSPDEARQWLDDFLVRQQQT